MLILLHRPFAKTFGVIRGAVKLCESLATSLFAASAAYLACVAGDTYSVSAGPCHSSEDTQIYGSPWAGDPRGGFVVHGRLSHDYAAHSLPQHYWFRWRYTRQRCISLTRLPSRDLFFYEKPEGRARPWFASIIFRKRLSSSLSAFRFSNTMHHGQRQRICGE